MTAQSSAEDLSDLSAMAPGKIEVTPALRSIADADDDNYSNSQSPQIPGISVQQPPKYKDILSSAVSIIEKGKKTTKSVYTILGEDDDEENQHSGEDSENTSKTTHSVTSQPSDSEISSEEGDTEVNVDENSTTNERLLILLTQAGPVTASFFLGFAGTFTNLIFASHFIGPDGAKSTVFAGVSLANMFANVTCMSLLIGKAEICNTVLHHPTLYCFV